MKFVKRLLNVTWNEIREAEREGEKTMTFELWDIFEKAKLGSQLDILIEKNIKEVLKREEILPEGGSIVIPAGALYWECEEEGEKGAVLCWYSAPFEVFDRTGMNILAKGEASGKMMLYDTEQEAELQYMEVEMSIDDIKKLKTLAKRIKSALSTIWE